MGEVLKVGRKPMSWNPGTVARFDSLLGYSGSGGGQEAGEETGRAAVGREGESGDRV